MATGLCLTCKLMAKMVEASAMPWSCSDCTSSFCSADRDSVVSAAGVTPRVNALLCQVGTHLTGCREQSKVRLKGLHRAGWHAQSWHAQPSCVPVTLITCWNTLVPDRSETSRMPFMKHNVHVLYCLASLLYRSPIMAVSSSWSVLTGSLLLRGSPPDKYTILSEVELQSAAEPCLLRIGSLQAG